MRHPYNDITDSMTRLIREHHQTRNDSDVIVCPTSFESCACVAKPLWWDEFGVPRFSVHTPLLCPKIGATEIILLQVACQNCAKEFAVQMSWDRLSAARELSTKKTAAFADVASNRFEQLVAASSLSYQIADRGPHYGDPPYHDNCRAGNTMNVWDLRVLEFWRRMPESIDYVRINELEVSLPDLANTERVGPS